MGLIIPRHSFSLEQHNFASTPGTTGLGTVVTASATANTKGSWVELIASADFEVHAITIAISSDTVTAVQHANLYDIGVGAASSEVVIISNISNTHNTSYSTQAGGARVLFLPIHIPKGTRVSARMQALVGSNDGVVTIILHGGADNWPWKSFDNAETVGTNTADSGATTHTFGATGTFSTWANIGSTLSRNYGAIMPLVTTGSDTNMLDRSGYVEFGINSTTMGRRYFTTHANEVTGFMMPATPVFGHFNNGEQMMIRGTMSSTADSDLEVALLCFW